MISLKRVREAVKKRAEADADLREFRTSFSMAEVVVGGKNVFVLPAIKNQICYGNDDPSGPTQMWMSPTEILGSQHALKAVNVADIEKVVRIVLPPTQELIDFMY